MSTERRGSAGTAGACVDCGGSAAAVSALFREPGRTVEMGGHPGSTGPHDLDTSGVEGVMLPGPGQPFRPGSFADRGAADFEGVVLPGSPRATKPAGYIELQPWTTLEGLINQYIVQPYSGWAECGAFNDAYVAIHVARVSRADIHIQTSIVDDDEYFQDMVLYEWASATGLFITSVLKTTASVPLENFVRWRIGGTTASWNATFRVLLLLKP